MLKLIRASLSFFTTIPVEGDIEILRRNLWVFPYSGALIGLIIALILCILDTLNLRIICIFVYLFLEGINHIDGLADFGDAFFAPKNKKIKALKDTRIGAGGVVFVTSYLIILSYAFTYVEPIAVVLGQILAKLGMLMAMITSKPSWSGMASYMMGYARKRDLIIGFFSIIPFIYLFPLSSLKLIITSTVFLILIKVYAERCFGGISGDVLGTINCIIFMICCILNL